MRRKTLSPLRDPSPGGLFYPHPVNNRLGFDKMSGFDIQFPSNNPTENRSIGLGFLKLHKLFLFERGLECRIK